MPLTHDFPPNVTTLFLPGLYLDEVRTARDYVSLVLRDETDDSRSTAALLTSELVTNALVHGDARNSACPRTGLLALRRPLHVTVEILGARICVLVCGSGSRRARVAPRPTLTWESSGRGLALVAALSAEWGTHGDTASRTVWFALDRAKAVAA
ncbi:ATP-binding protein [Nocardiopsis sp. RSe5-2]|uniref:ATP-binding protein n=1 Tax=Nocardiopsis endophytica TaxID=3018445 RepID=A0ABT4U000_9ACTN|nr:ATP-binding protein [Nocardiopsis endophytica]MDA2810279.1 ATP-binding protein [Nocardiopsis endophytica]